MAKLIIFDKMQEYQEIYKKMLDFTKNRTKNCQDQIWMLQHKPVYTYGAHTKPKMPKSKIPVFPTDRGGNITYHAPGQIILYTLIDTRRQNYSLHDLVNKLENIALKVAENSNIKPHTIKKRRGVYIENSKLASIGLRFKNFCSYHGLAINIDMDLEPFKLIEPCGYQQSVTNLIDHDKNANMSSVINFIISIIPKYLEINIDEESKCL